MGLFLLRLSKNVFNAVIFCLIMNKLESRFVKQKIGEIDDQVKSLKEQINRFYSLSKAAAGFLATKELLKRLKT